MPTSRSFAISLVAASFAGALSFSAIPAFAGERSVEVRYDDLDLRSDAGSAQLKQRVFYAVKKVCGSADVRNITELQDMKRCRQAAQAQSSHAVATALENARNGNQLASAGGLTITR